MIKLIKANNSIVKELNPAGYKGVDYVVIMQALEQNEIGFAKKVSTFLDEYPKINTTCKSSLPTLIDQAIVNSKTWRNFNTNLRRLANQFVVSSGIMTNADFQNKWFYEGVMEGRTKYGVNAPWIGDTVEEMVTIAHIPSRYNRIPHSNDFLLEKVPISTIKTKRDKWNEEIEWERKNVMIDKAIYG